MTRRPSTFIILCSLAFAAILFLYLYSRTTARGIAFFDSQGRPAAIIFHHHQLLLAYTNVSLGQSRAWTGQTFSASPTEMNLLRENLLADPVRSAEKYFFLSAATLDNTFSLAGISSRTFGVPIALPLLLLAIPPLRYTSHLHRLHRRRKRNQCPTCGYSLQNLTTPTCPECGTAHPTHPTPASA